MSPAEIAHRVVHSLSTRIERHGWRNANAVPTPDLSATARNFVVGGDDIRADRYVAAADDIVAGKLQIFALDTTIGAILVWNVDPKSGTKAPLKFGKTLNYRDEALVGDVKYLWEPNRHLHLVTLAQAWRLTGERRYVDTIERHIQSWLDQCPYPMGPNWTSSLELAIRLINWSIVSQLLGSSSARVLVLDDTSLRNRWLESIYRHMHFVRNHLSRYSSANNHLIGEAAGLFIAATMWPHWRECSGWANDARELLEREALRQNAADGVNLEQAISYEQFVLDFLILAGLAGRANGFDFSAAYWKRIETMLEYLASVMDVGGNVPMIGDADDGYAVRVSQEPDFCPYRSLIATGAVLFERQDLRAKAGKLDDKTRWLLGPPAEARFRELQPDTTALPVRRSFPDGGYYILGCDFESEKEIRAIVDAGPLGYLAIAAHGHADALALTLSVGGREFLVDPGTYAYHTQKHWRNYFRGTAAHNTIEVDGRDQSVIGGNFIWLRKANARCELWDANDATNRFVGSHDGYARLSDPVFHRREIVLDKGARLFRVTDNLECQGSHRVRCRWHFSEACRVVREGDTVVATNGDQSIRLKLRDAPGRFELERGESDPPSGWISRRFDVKEPTTTASAVMDIRGTTSFVTEILCS